MNRVQVLRSSLANERPPTGRAPGELYANWPDRQLGVIDAANQPMDLIAVRYFSTLTAYGIGDHVVEAGDIWRAIVPVTPAPFDPAQWTSLSAVAGDFVTDAELTAILADYATDADLAGYLPLAGGTMSGPITLAADAAAPLQAVPLQQLDAYAEWAGGTFTGPINNTSKTTSHFSGPISAVNFGIVGPAGTSRNILGYSDPVSAPTPAGLRWTVELGDSTPESGGNNGSNFSISTCNDSGAVGAPAISINRSNGYIYFANNTGYISAPVTNAFAITNVSQATYLQLDQAGNFLYGGGTGVAVKVGAGPWGAISDARIKNVESDYKQGLDKILKLEPVVYTYKGNDAPDKDTPSMHAKVAETKQQFVGLIAQAVETVFPECVSESAAVIDGKPVTDLRNLDIGPLTFALINAVKELSAKVTALEGAGSAQTTVNVVNPRARPSR